MNRVTIGALGALTLCGLGHGGALAAPPFGASAAVAEADLAKTTGREDVSQATMAEQTGTVADNSINGPSTTGEIRIDDNAFQNMSGLSILNANTGNNVAINASMQVNVAISPGN